MKKLLKTKKGISLIIAIIVILILISLIGISTTTITGGSGILAKAERQNVDDTRIKTREASTIIPNTEDIIIPNGTYLGGDQTIKGDDDLKPENIREGVSIFGVTGTLSYGYSENDLPDELTYSLYSSCGGSASASSNQITGVSSSGTSNSTIYIPTGHIYKRISITSGVTGYKNDGTSYEITDGDISDALYIKVVYSKSSSGSASSGGTTGLGCSGSGTETVTIYKQ